MNRVVAKRSRKKSELTGRAGLHAPPEAARKAGRPPARTFRFTRDWLYGLFLVLAVFLVYQPVWYAGYIWDDDDHLTANPTIVGPLGFKDIWTTRAADIAPLTRSTFWLEHKLWGLPPLPYHLVNVLLQAACAILLWRILRRLYVPGAWLGAALWALHPVEVESVAWISEMKNTESGLFFLLSIFFFIRGLKKYDLAAGPIGNNQTAAGPAKGWNYALTLLFAALAMASKSSTVILPAVFCLCCWWLRGRLDRSILKTAIPVSLMSVAASAVSIWTQGLQLATAQAPQWARTWPQRLAGAGDAVWFYLGKLLWPHPLIAIYPRWEIDATRWFSYLPLLAVVAVLFIFWFKRGSWSRPWFFALAWFLTGLLPVLGLFDNSIFRLSLVFDHLQYLASMGPLALAGAGIVRLADFAVARGLRPRSLAGAAVLLILGALSWQRVWAYESQETLWTDTLARNPNCWAAHYGLGNVFLRNGQTDEAIAHFQKALAINPGYLEADNNLGMALSQTGRVDEAIVHFQKALEINPDYAEAHNNLGNALGRTGRLEEAAGQYAEALKINPNYAEAHNNLGAVLAREGRLEDAIEQYKAALKIDPNFADAHYNLGDTLIHTGKPGEAIAYFQDALEIKPDYPEAHNSLGLAFAQEGRLDEAIAEFENALQLRPGYADARDNLARAQAIRAQALAPR